MLHNRSFLAINSDLLIYPYLIPLPFGNCSLSSMSVGMLVFCK